MQSSVTINNESEQTQTKEYCLYCMYAYQSPDKPGFIANLGFRFIYTLLAWILLGYKNSAGSSFFVSLLFFVSPLCVDYLKFEPSEKIRKYFKKISLCITFFWVIIGILGVFEIITLNNELHIQLSKDFIAFRSLNINISLLYVWYALMVNVIITLLDWIICEYPAENAKKWANEFNS
ncbi:hypothetical protein SAMN02745885_01673 [Carboxydocella sporoproducens DSM 16521]|uniref:Uncharacterized protein n=2 Tax=Carboxydocella TaxID=178898 RepID=A0A1T4QGV5_9FIRM|nr:MULTISPECIES: hypothetical protein [Carboxydocella]AVX21578.1 hypothetical protein CFE_2435 [Carboxydocella thermautotrophica]AVX31785.1 hypothetical protein CTH_2242 [Carboxydocella thermautotrophica]SKA02922.1 hypothetical protein SAMN02745885_01673 [Carboxydocella sporoproducens DSM 16521]